MKEKTVRQLMIPLGEYASVTEDRSLREALQVLDEACKSRDPEIHPHRAILVLNLRGEVVGKLSHWAVLRSLEPKLLYSQDVSSLERAGLSESLIRRIEENYSHFSGSLEQMCSRAARLRAGDAMVPVHESIPANSSLTEAVRLLVASHAQSLLVIEGTRAVGILRLSDVFEEVARLIREQECS